MARRTAAAVVVCLGVMTGCGGSQDDAVRAVVDDFYGAVSADDGQTACAALAPTTRSELEESSGKACAEAVLGEEVPGVTAPTAVEVFGTSAQVRFRGETAFLTRLAEGWRVVSAVCTPAPEHYDCRIQGA